MASLKVAKLLHGGTGTITVGDREAIIQGFNYIQSIGVSAQKYEAYLV